MLLGPLVLADDRINQFFRGIDMDAQGAKLNASLTMGFGGPKNYTGKELREGHTHLVRGGQDLVTIARTSGCMLSRGVALRRQQLECVPFERQLS